MLFIHILAYTLDKGSFYPSHRIIYRIMQIIISDLMPLKALGYFLSGVIGSVMSNFLGGYVSQAFDLIPLSLPALLVQGIIVGIFVLVGHLIIHKALKID